MMLKRIIKYLWEAKRYYTQVRLSDPHHSAVLLVFRSQSLKASWHHPIWLAGSGYLQTNKAQPSHTERAACHAFRRLSSQTSFHFLSCHLNLLRQYFKPISNFNCTLVPVCSSGASVNSQVGRWRWGVHVTNVPACVLLLKAAKNHRLM